MEAVDSTRTRRPIGSTAYYTATSRLSPLFSRVTARRVERYVARIASLDDT